MADERRCCRCGGVFPLTADHWYFAKSGARAGQVTGYCKPCQRAYWRAYVASVTDYQRAAMRARYRAWGRAHRAAVAS